MPSSWNVVTYNWRQAYSAYVNVFYYFSLLHFAFRLITPIISDQAKHSDHKQQLCQPLSFPSYRKQTHDLRKDVETVISSIGLLCPVPSRRLHSKTASHVQRGLKHLAQVISTVESTEEWNVIMKRETVTIGSDLFQETLLEFSQKVVRPTSLTAEIRVRNVMNILQECQPLHSSIRWQACFLYLTLLQLSKEWLSC